MENDLGTDDNSDLTSHEFFREKLVGPLAYLRGLVPEDGSGDAAALEALKRPSAKEGEDSAEAPAPPAEGKTADAPPTRSGSLLKHLEDALGDAPALDLPHGRAVANSASTESEPPPLANERYVVEGELAAGGMGRVLTVYDQDIRRRVAMKVLHADCREGRSLAKFFEEAQATGQLEHPNIAPVYDLGRDPDHGIFFTMKLVRGRNLREVLYDLGTGDPETGARFTLTRLIQILQQVAMGVHYAHARGVIHRDLKPDNIMVGDFGETLVMDWGLAKIVGRREADGSREASDLAQAGSPEPVDSHRQGVGDRTIYGTISGTPAYMSPEQARGWVDEIDERTDVFGLGAILYEMLTFHPPYEGENPRTVLGQAGACEIEAPRVRAPRRNVPGSLEQICQRALSAAKEDRYPDAKEFHEALQVFLDGTLEAQRREAEASVLVRQGNDKALEYGQCAAEEERLQSAAAERLKELHPHDSHELKLSGWELEDRANETRQKRIRVFNEATALLHSAINVDPSCSAAKEALADLYWMRFQEAERASNTDDMIMYRSLVERYQQGKFTKLLEGRGLLSIETDPAGAEVLVERLVQRGGRLVAAAATAAHPGRTPTRLELPIGYYCITLRKEGFRDTRYPVLIERCGRHVARVRLFTDEQIGDGLIYVPASECVVGGDSAAPGSLPFARRYIPDLFVGQFPVSFREYCAFLDDLRLAGDPDVPKWLPRTEEEGACVRLASSGRFEPALEVLDIDAATRARHPKGFEWDLPVLAVSWFAASRYARWLGERTGRRVRLPRDQEWEKAARGCGAVVYPWGDRFDWSFTKGALSRPERAQPEPNGTFDCDCSVYGVRDLAGSIREWCDDWFLENKYRLHRGGSWYIIQDSAFRAAKRQGTNPAICSSVMGFRIVVEPPAGSSDLA